jgi:hypothetical protein
MLEKQSSKNQVSPALPYPNTTELAGFMKVNEPRRPSSAPLSQLGEN